jgi:hypothetical protein
MTIASWPARGGLFESEPANHFSILGRRHVSTMTIAGAPTWNVIGTSRMNRRIIKALG